LASRSAVLKENNFKKAIEIAAWKEKIAAGWDAISVESVEIPEKLIHQPEVAENYDLKVVLDTKELNDKGIGVELVVTYTDDNNKTMLSDVEELKLVKAEGSKLIYSLEYKLNRAGTFKYAFRMFPKNEDLPHRQDFCFVRWI
jgi:starch phosphorylase